MASQVSTKEADSRAAATNRARRDRAVATGSPTTTLAVCLLLGSCGCSKIPPGRSAVDSVRILNAKEIKPSEVEEKLATRASTKFLLLFQGVAYDYAVYDEAVLQRDMARVERFYRGNGFFEAQARVARVFQVNDNHVRIEV